ncbi:acyltransferase [Curtobacterium sp. 314Chir4.1]|uniref:acyltransferase family protein n=1 Tax=Curtobacterium sp. 314Chir4.1 TaxID=1279028 RepID=UPI000BE397BC|nr:acyltransferase family protein [Curtobacterium sp. 314Chir4.1]
MQHQIRSRPKSSPRHDLDFLDGLRGVLVLLVVVGHAAGVGAIGALERDIPWLPPLLGAIEIRVPVFVVLSGYSLMIAVSMDPRSRLKGGWRGHVVRRTRRLVPPYLIALVLTLLLIAVVPAVREDEVSSWSLHLPVTWQSVVTHALLVHNLFPDTIFSIVGPWWSLGVEWQLGLLLPLVLVAWRRIDPAWVVAAMFALSAASSVTGVLKWSAPFALGLFGLGMYVAHLTHGRDGVLEQRRPRLARLGFDRPFVLVGLAVVLFVGAIALGWLSSTGAITVPTDAARWVLSGAGGAVLIAVLTDREVHGSDTALTRRVRRVFTPLLLRRLGLVSYSAYLIHRPILAAVNLGYIAAGMPTAAALAVQLLVVVPLVFGLSVVFAWLFERPFMNSHQRSQLTELLPKRPGRNRMQRTAT